MKEYLSFVTIDFWEIIFTWVNLLILYLLMKKFLFKPVREMIEKREQEVEDIYETARITNEDAYKLKSEYEQRLSSAKEEARGIVDTANKKAIIRSEEIVQDAKEKATVIIKKANVQIEDEKNNAINQAKNHITTMAVSIASKVIEKDINENDHKDLVEKFINEMGETAS